MTVKSLASEWSSGINFMADLPLGDNAKHCVIHCHWIHTADVFRVRSGGITKDRKKRKACTSPAFDLGFSVFAKV